MIIIFGRLRAAGLKFNAPRCSFGLKDIPYLGYVIKREGVKPDPNKLQGIMDLWRTATTTETRVPPGMVQYYRVMFPIRSHILDHLKKTDSGPKVRKYCGMTH